MQKRMDDKGHIINVFTQHEYAERMIEAAVLARAHYPDSEKMRGRVLRLAEALSKAPWEEVKGFPTEQLTMIMEGMIKDGWPGDEPSDSWTEVISETRSNQSPDNTH